MEQEPHIDITIKEDDIVRGAIEIVRIIRPCWSSDEFHYKIFKDGITNNLVGIWHQENFNDMVLVRIYGHNTDLLIDRKNEIQNIKVLHEAGYTHKLYATFNNGFAYEFLPGNILTTENVRQPKVYQLVAKRMAQMHLLKPKINGEQKPQIWDKTEQFLALIPRFFSDEAKQKKFVQVIKPYNILEQEYLTLKSQLSLLDSPCVFAHNDLLLANILYCEDDSNVTFIDFEYTSYNYQAYDIANHFAEFAGVENIDFSLYPDEKLQKHWLKLYLETYEGRDNISEDQVAKLYEQVNRFVLLSHFFWGCWSLIQSQRSHINFDFLTYASVRFEEFFRRKSLTEGLN